MSLLRIIKRWVSSEKERRGGDRFKTRIPAALKTESHAQMVEVLDLSKTGCGIRSKTTYLLLSRQIVEMELIYVNQLGYLFVSKEPILAVVVRADEKREMKVGVRFLEKINDKNAIENVLNDLEGRDSLRN